MVTRENAEGLFQSGGDGLRGQMVLAPSGMVATAHVTFIGKWPPFFGGIWHPR